MRLPQLFVGLNLIAVLAVGRPAAATPVTFTDTFDPADVLFSNSLGTCTGTNTTPDSLDIVTGQSGGGCSSLTYTQGLTGYTAADGPLTDATLTMFFYDNADSAAEKFQLTLDEGSFNNQTIVNGSTAAWPSTHPFDVLLQVASDGTLTVNPLARQAGDFYFARSTLVAHQNVSSSEQNVAATPVPEPASLILLGSGLAFAARRLRGGRRWSVRR